MQQRPGPGPSHIHSTRTSRCSSSRNRSCWRNTSSGCASQSTPARPSARRSRRRGRASHNTRNKRSSGCGSWGYGRCNDRRNRREGWRGWGPLQRFAGQAAVPCSSDPSQQSHTPSLTRDAATRAGSLRGGFRHARAAASVRRQTRVRGRLAAPRRMHRGACDAPHASAHASAGAPNQGCEGAGKRLGHGAAGSVRGDRACRIVGRACSCR